jgi:hypothetical protein
MSLVSVLSAISRWSDVADWRSWITHAAIAPSIALVAAGLGWVFGVPRPLIVGCSLAVLFYFLREGEQIAHELIAGMSIPAKHWLDHFMDILAPAVTCFGLSRLF